MSTKTQIAYANQPVTLYTQADTGFTCDGYDFLGWSKSSTATVATYIGGQTTTFNSDTSLYAVWKEKESQTPDSGDAGGDTSDSGSDSGDSGGTSYTPIYLSSYNVSFDNETEYGNSYPFSVYSNVRSLTCNKNYVVVTSSYNPYSHENGFSYFAATLSGIGSYNGLYEIGGTSTKITQYIPIKVAVLIDNTFVSNPNDYVTGFVNNYASDTLTYTNTIWGGLGGSSKELTFTGYIGDQSWSTIQTNGSYQTGKMYYTSTKPVFKQTFSIKDSTNYNFSAYWYGQHALKILRQSCTQAFVTSKQYTTLPIEFNFPAAGGLNAPVSVYTDKLYIILVLSKIS